MSTKRMDNKDIVKLLELLTERFPQYDLTDMAVAIATIYCYAAHLEYKSELPHVYDQKLSDHIAAYFAAIMSSLTMTVGSNIPKEELN